MTPTKIEPKEIAGAFWGVALAVLVLTGLALLMGVCRAIWLLA